MATTIEKEYTVHLDTKNRFTLRGAVKKYKYYRVKALKGGHFFLSPQKLVPSSKISQDTLRQIAQSVRNLKSGKVSGPIGITAARKLLRG